MNTVQTFGAYLKEKRQAKRTTQRALAAECGIDHTYLSKLENEATEYRPSEELILKIASALEIDPDEALSRAGKVASDVVQVIVTRPHLAKQIRSEFSAAA